MRRRYNFDLFVRRINKIKSIIPDACIGVDVIVGFPGESDDNFQETSELLNQLDVSYLHVFSYSQRDNTDAVKIKPKISQQTIVERGKILHRLSMKKKRQFYEKNIGKIRQVLFETYEEGILSGYSENYISVSIKGNKEKVNQIEVLNRDYRRQNPDTINTRSVFDSLAVDTNIEFCLATTDPFGQPTSGITRTQTTETSFIDLSFNLDNSCRVSQSAITTLIKMKSKNRVVNTFSQIIVDHLIRSEKISAFSSKIL